MFLKVLLVLVPLLSLLAETFSALDVVVCYFSSSAVYRKGHGTYKPEYIDTSTCTHINYAFLGVDTAGKISILDQSAEVDQGGLENVAALKKSNSKLKVLASMGGSNAGHELLANVITSSTRRKTFIDSCIDFFETWNFDGLDINWEYPTAADEANFVTLLLELKQAFGDDYVLTVGVPASPREGYNVPGISSAVDYFNIMAYDFHTFHDGYTGHNAALYSNPDENPTGNPLSVNDSISSWIDLGASPAKINLGIAFYGHTFNLTSAKNNDVGDEVSGPGPAGPYTQEAGILGYNEICEFYDRYTRAWDEVQQGSYRYDGTLWISSEDRMAISVKVDYAVNLGLAGFMVWTVDEDDFSGLCGSKYPLLQAISDEFHNINKSYPTVN